MELRSVGGIEMNRIHLVIMRAFAISFALILSVSAIGATAQDNTTYGHATFYTPNGQSIEGALLTVTSEDGTVLRETTAGVNDSVIWLSPRFEIGTIYCLSVDATAHGFLPWYGCEVTTERRLHFDVYLEQVIIADLSGTVKQNGNERPVANANVCVVELGVCATTDATGAFSIAAVPAGTYTVHTTADGFKLQTSTVTVTADGAWIDIVQYKGNGKPGNGNN